MLSRIESLFPSFSSTSERARALLHPVVLVGALGYFVDIYDLILFGVGPRSEFEKSRSLR